MRTRRGTERGSVAKYELRLDHPVSERFFSHEKLARAMIRLCARVVDHSFLAGVSQIVGMSIRVGIRIINIVEDSGFAGGQCRECGLLLLKGLGLR